MIDNGGAVLIMMVDVEPGQEDAFNLWYNEQHIPEMLALPGVRAARRFESVQGGAKYLAVYEIDEPAVLDSPEFIRWRDGSESTQRMRKNLTSVTRGVYREIFFASK